MPVNPLRCQLPVLSPVDAAGIVRALRARLGPGRSPLAELTELLTRRYEARKAVLFGSGTEALTAALAAAMRITRSPAVALPAYSCYDVASAAVGANARIALYDLDPLTLGPDWSSFERALAAGARVAVLAPLYGIPCDWQAAESAAARHGAILIEDAAQAAGATWAGRPVGALGAASVLSFGRGKGWTGGGGGALLIREPDIAAAEPPPAAGYAGAASLVKVVGQVALGRPAWYGLPRRLPWLHLGETIYRAPRTPAGMAPVCAALVLATASAAVHETTIRQRNAAALRRELESRAGDPITTLPSTTDERAVPGYLRLPCLLPPPTGQAPQIDVLGKWGVQRGYPGTLGQLEAVRDRLLGPGGEPLPGALRLAADLVTLPTHHLTTESDRNLIVRHLTITPVR